ncbi:acyl-CoA synthetase [Microbacterium telephonicum]|uniref:acyl-CoA synthetase n=1 Tax=Microbacterium telephonicum TaxID=1714841 RepID=UPI001F54450A|nr:acyl-CoA synthetase [Microbacterium telephonicum]
MPAAASRTFEVRHLQLARALFAALAAVMITFSPDHSATVGLSVFSGFAIAAAIVELVAAWLVYASGARAAVVLLGVTTLLAGMGSGIPALRSTTLFFVVVIAWAFLSGIIELVTGIRGRRSGDPAARDAVLIGSITIALGVGLLLVNPAYSLEYFIKEAGQSFTLTGITIGVGIFGGYAAIIAVFLGIAGFSPRRVEAASTPSAPGVEAPEGTP